MRFFLLALIFFQLMIVINISSQGVYAPLNSEYYHLIDRYEIKSGKFSKGIFTSYKPTLRKDISILADSVSALENISMVDKFNISYLKNDNWEWYEDSLGIGNSSKPIFKMFYQKNNALFQFRSKEFEMQVNPVLNFELRSGNRDYPLSLNSRGLEIRGLIGKKIGFYTFLTDNQAFVPDYVKRVADSTLAFPNEGFTKIFKNTGYDFFSARGYINFNIIKQIGVQFGHDKNFIGNGTRSLYLSDYSSKYLFLKITTKVWKFNYTNLFAELTADVINNDKYNPRKYMAVHHLSINLSRNLNIGLFEAVMFNRDDSTGNGGFELNYLNPIIFYREVESYLGSKDKTSVGIDLKWNFLKHFSFYGQFVLNEFKLSHLQAQNGWWGNKYAWQLGLKYIDAAGIKNLDLQLEHNFVRPFMYADKNRYSSISNYNQPLAHPLGANFFEVIGIIRYQPINRLFVTGKAFYIVQGKDHSGLNFGSNILKETGTRTNEFGNNIGVGDKTNTILVSLNVSYMLFHNFYIDLREQYRMEKNSSITNSSLYTSLGIRWNIAQRLHEF